MYIHMYSYKCICICIHINVYVYVCICINVYIYINVYIGNRNGWWSETVVSSSNFLKSHSYSHVTYQNDYGANSREFSR